MGSDVVAAGAALAGFILIYLGAVSTSFSTFDSVQQDAVRGMFAKRAWFAFAGIVLSLLTVALALLAKWTASDMESSVAVYLLFVTLLWSAIIALIAVLDVK